MTDYDQYTSILLNGLVDAAGRKTDVIVRAESVAADLSVSSERGWLERALEEFQDAGLIANPVFSGPVVPGQGLVTSHSGVVISSDRIADELIITDLGIKEASRRADESRLSLTQIQSTDWTGLATRIGSAQLAEIQHKIAALNDAILQSDADAQTKLNAIKRVEAVRSLLEAPDVPWKDVVEILNSPSVAAFLTALNIIQFIIGLAQ